MDLIISILLAMGTSCPTEDSTNCYWDAQVRGNGEGTSLINLDEGTYIKVGG